MAARQIPAEERAAAGAQERFTGLPVLARAAGGGFASIFAFWAAIPLLLGALLLLFAEQVSLRAAVTYLGVTTLSSLVWTVVTVLVFRLTARYSLETSHRLERNVVLLGTGVVVALSVALVAIASLTLIAPDHDGSAPPVGAILGRMLVPNLMIYAGIAVTGLARDASLRARARREEAVRLQAHNAELQAQLAEARLRVLHTQLNPHFLFNTLNAVSGLMDEDPRGARRMIARLSELLRYALHEATESEIPLREELKLVRRYLEIVEIRYQGRLETGIDAAPGLEEALVPSLILQPLAENAMKHGVGRAGGHGRIEVTARREGERLLLRVLDTGGGAPMGPDGPGEGGGIGLRHTRERLRELYGDAQRFTLAPRAEGGMVAEIEIPYHTTALPPAAAVEVRA